MQEWLSIYLGINANERFRNSFQLSLKSLRQYEHSLFDNLKNALILNKELILNLLYSNYFSNSSSQQPTNQEQARESQQNDQQSSADHKLEQKIQSPKLRSKIKKKRENYDTKNIPKNFGTAIHIFIKRNSNKVKTLLAQKKISFSQFYTFNKEAKQKINSLLHLRQLWQSRQGDSQRNLKECYRIISFEFMRRHCLKYIYSSRIKNTSSHVRYRKKLLQGIQKPESLFNLKDY